MKSQIHQRIRAARQFANMSQQEIAKACGVTRPAISQWEALVESKRTTPGIDQVKIIAQVTRVPLSWLLDDEADPDSVWQFTHNKGWQPSPKPQAPAGVSRSDFIAGLRFEISTGAAPLLGGLSSEGLDWAQGDLAVAYVLPGEPMDAAAGRLLLSAAPRRRMVFVAAPVPPQALALQQALAVEVLSADGISAAAKALL